MLTSMIPACVQKEASRVADYMQPRSGILAHIKWAGYRIWNAVKHIFGQSDWQVAKKTITAILLDPKNEIFSSGAMESSEDQETKAAKATVELGLCLAVDKKFNNPKKGMELIAERAKIKKIGEKIVSKCNACKSNPDHEETHR